MQRLAKRHGAKVVFWLHNFAYTDRAVFAAADYVVVHAEFTQRYYREKLGLNCHRLPYIVHWKEAEQRSEVGSHVPLPGGTRSHAPHAPCLRYVTFINPQETKGVFVLRGSPASWRGGGRTFRFWSRRAAAAATR